MGAKVTSMDDDGPPGPAGVDDGDGELFDIVAPHPAALIESMRSVGYTPAAAVADVVDNSVSADARNVWLSFVWDGPASFVTIRDDGLAMSPTGLRDAMRLGSQSPTEARAATDLGRFGLGLKTASFSLCRRLTVASKPEAGSMAIRRWDLDQVAKTNVWQLLKSPAPGSDSRLEDLAAADRGTVVLWEEMDRIVGDTSVDDTRAHRRFLDLIESVQEHLAMVFHRFLEDRSRFAMWINGTRIEPWDPFLSREPIQRLAPENLTSNGFRIEIRPYVMPHHSKISPEVHARGAGPYGWNAHQGFYIYRNRRLLVPGDWLRLGFEKEEHAKLARIQVDLPNGADDAWSIDVKKSTAHPPGALREEMRRIAIVTRQRAGEVYRHRGKVIARSASAEYAFVWSKVIKHRKISYRVNRDHPLVKRTLAEAGSHRAGLEALLRTVEETVPAPQIALDINQTPDDMAVPFERAATPEVLAILGAVYVALRADGMSDDAARARIMVMEPFDQFLELVTSYVPDGSR